MYVFMVSMGADTAGTQIGMTRALRLHGGAKWTARSLATGSNYIRYPKDMAWNEDEARKEWHRADVLLLGQDFQAIDRWGEPSNAKGIIIQHHGSKYRRRFEHLNSLAEQYRAVVTYSTLDLAQYAPPGALWLPGAVDVPAMAVRGSEGRSGRLTGTSRGGRGVKIGHAPTDRGIKDTEAFIKAVRRLSRRHSVYMRMIERSSWQTCLRQKAACDIFYDQVQLGYGMNAVEAWAMGMPVVAGTTDPFTQQKMLDTFGQYPFVFATPTTIYEALEALMDQGNYLNAVAAGVQHVQKYHSYEAIASRIRDLCEVAIERR